LFSLQKLDTSASVAVLNSYLCSGVADGSKVMHVISWVKKALHARQQADTQKVSMQKKVHEMQLRVKDTRALAEQTNSPNAIHLAEQTETDLAVAEGRLSNYERMEEARELGEQRGAKKAPAKKAAKKAVKKAAQKEETPDQRQSRLIAKAKSLKVQSTKMALMARAATGDVAVLNQKIRDAPAHRVAPLQEELHKEQKRSGLLRHKQHELQRLADAAQLEADEAADVPVEKHSAALKASQDALLKANKAFNEEKKKEASLVKQKVDSMHKTKLASATVAHAKKAGHPALVKSSQKLLDAANKESKKVAADASKASQKFQEAAAKLQKLATKHAKLVSVEYKQRISKAIAKGKKMSARAKLLLSAQKLQANAYKRKASMYSAHAQAADGVASKSEQGAVLEQKKHAALMKQAESKETTYSSLLNGAASLTRAIKRSVNEIKLAKASGEVRAVTLAKASLAMNQRKLRFINVHIKKMGRTPKDLQREAKAASDKATADEQVETAANTKAFSLHEKATAQNAVAKKAFKEVKHLSQVFLPQLARHISKRVAWIEHKLAKELASLHNMGTITPKGEAVKGSAAAEQAQLRKSVEARRKKARIAMLGLKHLRSRLNEARKKAELGVKHAKEVEDQTAKADKEIVNLKKQACGKVTQFEADIVKAKKEKKDAKQLELELGNAQKACKEAAESLAAARTELNKRAQGVNAATAKAKKLEAQYAAADASQLSRKLNGMAQQSAEADVESQKDQQKLNALNAMIRNGKQKIADAELMHQAATASKDEQQLEISKSAGAAAHHHMIELEKEKAALLGKVHKDHAELGEFNEQIQEGSEHMHEIADKAMQTQSELGAAQFAADEEGEETDAEQEVDALTMKVAKDHTALLGETNKNVDLTAEIKAISAKLTAIDNAASDMVKMLEATIHKKPTTPTKKTVAQKAEEAKLTKDIKLAAIQTAQLAKLEGSANQKAKDAKKALDEEAKKGDKADKAKVSKLKAVAAKADKDAKSVKKAENTVEARKASDKTKLDRNSALSNSVTKFAEKLKNKFIKMTALAGQAKKNGVHAISGDGKANAAKLAEANKRITALEAAISQLGGLKSVEAAEGSKPSKKAEASVEADKAKLSKIEQKIATLDDQFIKAKVSKNTKAQIKLGTEKKDLEEEADNIRTKLKSDYGIVAVPVVKISEDTSASVAALKKKEATLKAAVAKAHAAKVEREKLLSQEADIRKKLNGSMKAEHSKIADANKAKASLAMTMAKLKKQEQGEKGQAQEMKAKLAAKETALKSQEKKAQSNSDKVKSEIASTEVVLNKSESTLKVAKDEAEHAVKEASTTVVTSKNEVQSGAAPPSAAKKPEGKAAAKPAEGAKASASSVEQLEEEEEAY